MATSNYITKSGQEPNVSPVAINVSWRWPLVARNVSPRPALFASLRTDNVELLQIVGDHTLRLGTENMQPTELRELLESWGGLSFLHTSLLLSTP
jgi:hypothetical protein